MFHNPKPEDGGQKGSVKSTQKSTQKSDQKILGLIRLLFNHMSMKVNVGNVSADCL